MAKASTITFVMIALLVVVVFLGGYYIWSDQQQTALEEEREVAIREEGVSLMGKPAELSVYCKDLGNDNTKTAAGFYIIVDPEVTDNEITGNFAADGTTASTTARKSVTEGLTVSSNYLGIASNSTYFGFPTEIKSITKQAENVDLGMYTTVGTLDIVVKDKDENILTMVEAATNLTLGADESEVLDEIEFQCNDTDKAVNLAGFYIDLPAGTNITGVEISAGYSGTPGVTESNINLKSTEADDYLFLFDSPQLLLEYDSVELSRVLKLTADGDGCCDCNGEYFEVYALDKIWTKSSLEDKMIYAYETDATSPADIGVSNPKEKYLCAVTA